MVNLRHIHILLLVSLMWIITLNGTNGQTLSLRNYSFHELPTQSKMPTTNAGIIIQDKEGYFWYGTGGEGLCMDDGYTIRTFSSKTEGRGVMTSDEVSCLCEDTHGRIWFGTRSGLYVLNKKNYKITKIKYDLFDAKKVNSLCLAHDGNMWAGAAQSAVKFNEQGKVLNVLSIGDNPRQEIKEMMLDSKGTLWMTILRGGLFTIDSKTEKIQERPWPIESAASYIIEDPSHSFYWVGTWGNGVIKYSTNGKVIPMPDYNTNEAHSFGREVNNMFLDSRHHIMWVSTMDDLYAYSTMGNVLTPISTSSLLAKEKKLLGKVIGDRHGNIWVPGASPHTFAIAWTSGGIRRDNVATMTNKMGYKIMVDKIIREGDYYWIYQRRTRLSLYNSKTGEMTFMATDAQPAPLTTQKVLAKCDGKPGVWSCNGKHLVHIWHDGMTIHWTEDTLIHLPEYISAITVLNKSNMLIGTACKAYKYNILSHKLDALTDSVGVIHSIGWGKKGLEYSLDPNVLPHFTDRRGHVWTLTENELTEKNPKTGASRVIRATDKNVNVDYFTDMTLAGDSVCLGGIGAFCMIAPCAELDKAANDDRILLVDSTHLSSMNHLYAATIQYAYRFVKKGLFGGSGEWIILEPGNNEISYDTLGSGEYTLEAKCTDEYGRWSEPQQLSSFSVPAPVYLRWYSWLLYIAVTAFVIWFIARKMKEVKVKTLSVPHETQVTPTTATNTTSIPSENGISSTSDITANATTVTQSEATETAPMTTDTYQTRKTGEFKGQLISDIMKNIDNPQYDADMLAKNLNLSRSNLYRKFQRITGDTSLSEFIRNIRIDEGKRLLRETTLSVTEIAYKVGFSSSQYFAKCFRDATNMTPKEYRNSKA